LFPEPDLRRLGAAPPNERAAAADLRQASLAAFAAICVSRFSESTYPPTTAQISAPTTTVMPVLTMPRMKTRTPWSEVNVPGSESAATLPKKTVRWCGRC